MNNIIHSIPMMITAHIDGACSGNPGPGGWGVYAMSNDGSCKQFSGYAPDTTNQRMELLAGIMALVKLPIDCPIHVISDSQYLVKGMNEWLFKWKSHGWKNSNDKSIANRDLWEQLNKLSQNRAVTWEWVKGHSGNHWNDKADKLAKQAIRSGRLREAC